MFLLPNKGTPRKYIKVIYCLSTIPLFLIIKYMMLKSQNHFFPSLFVDSSVLQLSNALFRDELINEHLASYSRMYDNAPSKCNTTSSLNTQGEHHFLPISKLLITLRQQMILYPNEYFHGLGIVLSVGHYQLPLARVNLKMIEHSGTKLHVQIWYSSTQVSEKEMMDLLNQAPKLNARICCFDTAQCRDHQHTWQLNSTHVYKPRTGNPGKSFPYKPAAIISATFTEVLFLDCDAYVTRDPIDLFLSDPMYLKFGALF
ncbi:unnamed protein product, partial [Rotaria sp. Silwood2]